MSSDAHDRAHDHREGWLRRTDYRRRSPGGDSLLNKEIPVSEDGALAGIFHLAATGHAAHVAREVLRERWSRADSAEDRRLLEDLAKLLPEEGAA